MSKKLKRYNEATRDWEPVSAPDVSLVQNISGDSVTDDNVYITNYNYTEDGETGKTLNDTLSEISDDISRLQRNVSWLAEHGGGGGSGGGGGQPIGTFGFMLITPVGVENGGAYYTKSSDTTLTVTFMITGSTDESIQYSWQFDSNAPSDYRVIKTNTEYMFTIDLSNTTSKSHSVTLNALNPYTNMKITPFTFHIYESSLSVVFDAITAGNNYSNGIFNVLQNDMVGAIPLIITNGLVGSSLSLVAHAEGYEPYTHPVQKNTDDKPRKFTLPLWKIVNRENVSTSSFYVVTIDATATLGENVATEQIIVRIRIIKPDDITIVLGINGIGEAEQATAKLESVANYNFKVYAPIGTNYVYYAAKLTYHGEEERIVGAYYSPDLNEGEGTRFADNPSTPTEAVVFNKFTVSSAKYAEGETVTLSVKVWNTSGTREKEVSREILIEPPSTDKFPRQYLSRDGVSEKDTLFASWNETNALPTNKSTWHSEVSNYYFLSSQLYATENGRVSLDMNMFNGNDRSGIQTDTNIAHFRLQNHAYATVDFSRYADELANMVSQQQGFTISVAVNIDQTTDTNHTVFLWGNNNPDGTLQNGIRIDSDKIYWSVWENKGNSMSKRPMSCNIQQGERVTVDFSYEYGPENSNAKIYVNGVMNAAISLRVISNTYPLPNTAYFGCNVVNSVMSRFSDVDVYEFSIYTKVLNDLFVVVNSKNARLEGDITDPVILADYNNWKKKNFIEKDEDDPTLPTSIFYTNDGTFTEIQVREIATNSNIPTLMLTFDTSSTDRFDKDYFYDKHTTDDSEAEFDARGEYHDPTQNKSIESVNFKVSLQGTTTLGYRVKNLELKMADKVTIDGVEYTVLFQPKKEWFPERQFTLKADVVDSSHANNAVIGEWINNCGLFRDNPAMSAFSVANRPKDVDNQGVQKEHLSNGVAINYDEDVKIRHTLEGFPILLFISFAGSDYYDFIGTYSFNLGRFSYYNMGMKFLECFSRRDEQGNRVSCPAIIRYYKEKPVMGGINSATDVYSFELGNAGNLQVRDYPVWSQYDEAIVRSYGKFKYPEVVSDGDEIYGKLCELFEATATTPVSHYNRDSVTIFNDIYPYTIDETGHYTKNGTQVINQHIDNVTSLVNKLNYWNAAAYYVVANAFGMGDSLGKNMVLRTWDRGETWWTCFYDMDTALALVNNGSEDNPVTMAVDKIYTTTDPITQKTETGITYHDEDSRYAAYLSKIWGLLRDDDVLYAIGGEALRDKRRLYEDIWSDARKSGGVLSSSDKFVDMMKERVGTCGELIYNYDYRSKYILDTYEQDEVNGVYPAINFLHGTRIGFVRDWLKKHFYFLDGLFDASRLSGLNTKTYEDSPYYNQFFNLSVFFNQSINNLRFTIQVATPTFVSITTGSDNTLTKRFYVEKENTDTVVYVPNNTSQGSQMTISSASLITKFGGLNDGFQNIMDGNAQGIVKSMVEFVGGPSNKLSNSDPFKSQPFIRSGESALEKLDLSNTHWPIKLDSYSVDLSNFDRILWVNISYSDVTSINLPNSSLDYLNVSYSDITSLEVLNQNKITDVSLEGCNKLNTVRFENCEKISAVTIDSKTSLIGFNVTNCQSVTAITITDCPNLQNITISNNRALKRLIIDNSTAYGIDCNVMIIGCDSLETLVYRGTTNRNPIVLDYSSAANIKNLDMYACNNFAGIKYNEEDDVETYQNYYVLDLSKMTSLENASFQNVSTLKYLRFNNDINGTPVRISNVSLYGTAIERVFGYIEIAEPGVFDDKTNFYLNDLGPLETVAGTTYQYGQWHDRSDNQEDYFFVGDYVANVKLTATDLSRLMRATSANLGDVYYLLSLCTSAVTTTAYMFRACENIVKTIPAELSERTDCILAEDMFKYCTGLQDADHMFQECINLKGCVPAKLMHDLTSTVTRFCYVFPDGMFYDKEFNLFAEENDIEIVEGFNPVFIYMQHEDGPTGSEFWERYGIPGKDLLKGLDKVTEINDSFNGSQIGLSGDDTGQLLKGKLRLTKIARSFNNIWDRDPWARIKNLICDPNDLTSYSSRLQIIDGSFNFGVDAGYTLILYGDSFFKSCRTSLTTVSNSFGGYANKVPDDDDCQYGNFPYKIFDGMTKLENIVGFFERFCLVGNAEVIEDEEIYVGGTPLTLTFPSYIEGNTRYDMFGTCTSLRNISGCFKKLMYGTYSLVPDGFKNNKIENVSDLFDEYDNEIDDNYTPERKAVRTGMIPYHFFYQEEEGEELHIISAMTYVFNSTDSRQVTYYTMDTSSNDIADYLMQEDGQWVWNIYKHDGTDAFATKIQWFLNNLATVQSQHPELFSGGQPLFPQEVPDDLKDYLNEPRSTSEYIADTSILGGIFLDPAIEDIFKVHNYFCPPDIFKYCDNSQTTDITGVFRNASNGVIGGNTMNPKVAGYFGKCPPMLFRPLSRIQSLSSVFEGFSLLLPYSWVETQHTVLNENNQPVTIVENPKQYPPSLFTPLTNIRFMENTFKGTTIFGGTQAYPMEVSGLFDTFGQTVTRLEYIWDTANWNGQSVITSTLFSSCSRLESVAGMFSKNGPLMMYGSLFDASRSTLVNCSAFMQQNSRTVGTVPDFWNMPKMKTTEKAYYQINPTVTNYDLIPPAYTNG